MRPTIALVGMVVGCSSCASPTIRSRLSLVSRPSPDQAIEPAIEMGGLGNDWAVGTWPLDDGGSLTLGDSLKSFAESTDYLAIRRNAQGSVLWARTYGGTWMDRLNAAIVQPSGSALLIGNSSSMFFTPMKRVGSHYDASRGLVLWLNGDGRLQNARLLGFRVEGAATLADGSVVLVGTEADVEVGRAFMARVNPDRSLAWVESLELDAPAALYCVVERGSDVLVSGTVARSSVDWHPILMAFNAQGEVRWSREYQLSGSYAPRTLIGTPEGAVFAGPYSADGRTLEAFIVTGVDELGSLRFARSIESSSLRWPQELAANSDGSLRVVGTSFPGGGESAAALATLNADGSLAAVYDLRAYASALASAEVDPSGGLLITGTRADRARANEIVVVRVASLTSLPRTPANEATLQLVPTRLVARLVPTMPPRDDFRDVTGHVDVQTLELP